jgi:hypothetical protein
MLAAAVYNSYCGMSAAAEDEVHRQIIKEMNIHTTE